MESVILSGVLFIYFPPVARLKRFSKHRAEICISHRLPGLGISPDVKTASKGTLGGAQYRSSLVKSRYSTVCFFVCLESDFHLRMDKKKANISRREFFSGSFYRTKWRMRSIGGGAA